MKYNHIAILAIAFSLIAVTFVSTVAATEYTPYLSVDKKGRIFTFTVETQRIPPYFDGRTVDENSIELKVETEGTTITLTHDQFISITKTFDSIVITVFKQDLPVKATASYVTGSILGTSDAFTAAGPGWGLGAHR